jgi:hypothetical protein
MSIQGQQQLYNVPEPQPVNSHGSVEVLELIKRDFEKVQKTIPAELKAKVLEQLQARSDYGFNKYGTRLAVPNGRDFWTDMMQELLDCMVYAFGEAYGLNKLEQSGDKLSEEERTRMVMAYDIYDVTLRLVISANKLNTDLVASIKQNFK